MIDYCLKFTDKAQAVATLYDPIPGSDPVEYKPRYLAIDEIGEIYKPTGNMISTEYGNIPEMAVVPGYHANVRTEPEAPELTPYQVFPTSPSRVWA
jgi:hypothetical protein